ncbi:MAG TPA: enoyl-CoA hydratase/isomerase family protein [Terriglobales bacterium]|nr:enoyl-CoA hydratase/isomerase family protein [Terriglobales bacterium]
MQKPHGERLRPSAKCQVLTAEFFHLENHDGIRVLRLRSDDGTNRLTRDCVLALTDRFRELARRAEPLIVAGSRRFFSAGADLSEIAALTGSEAREFSRIGQTLMSAVERFPAPVYAAICGYCMGGGLDLALACHRRIASPDAVLAHRGAALGLITGWGGTQRLPRLVGKAKALEMFVAADKLHAGDALRHGLVDGLAEDPVAKAVQRIHSSVIFT